jgi:hypothetical protein
MTTDILIDALKLKNNGAIPNDVIPKRYAIATNILCVLKTTNGAGFLLLNSEPEISNTWYPFYTTINAFHTFEENQYKSLVDEFSEKIISDVERNRISDTTKKFSEMFGCGEVLTENMNRNEYWLKYSKSKNVWTIYLFEFYVISFIENKNEILSRLDSVKTLLPLDEISLEKTLEVGKVNNVPIVENIRLLLKEQANLSLLNKSAQ